MAEGAPAPHRIGLSLWIGTTLVLLGVVVNISATFRHWRTVGRLSRNEPLRFGQLSLGIIVAVFLAVLGLVTAAYLHFESG